MCAVLCLCCCVLCCVCGVVCCVVVCCAVFVLLCAVLQVEGLADLLNSETEQQRKQVPYRTAPYRTVPYRTAPRDTTLQRCAPRLLAGCTVVWSLVVSLRCSAVQCSADFFFVCRCRWRCALLLRAVLTSVLVLRVSLPRVLCLCRASCAVVCTHRRCDNCAGIWASCTCSGGQSWWSVWPTSRPSSTSRRTSRTWSRQRLWRMVCSALLCCAMLCYAMLYYAVLCYAMLCYAMLC